MRQRNTFKFSEMSSLFIIIFIDSIEFDKNFSIIIDVIYLSLEAR